ncbi:hypothetical protein [Parashewanella tropica]|uniref:hypothetical protein n=1 Tax=Parashewanella tropica TaxID=2547970 RepID=UPI0010596147|nr:hypothetical protein [Parashewanella tropica]
MLTAFTVGTVVPSSASTQQKQQSGTHKRSSSEQSVSVQAKNREYQIRKGYARDELPTPKPGSLNAFWKSDTYEAKVSRKDKDLAEKVTKLPMVVELKEGVSPIEEYLEQTAEETTLLAKETLAEKALAKELALREALAFT